jgi:dTDP-4-dehydrorhamnose 3,5-epimerase
MINDVIITPLDTITTPNGDVLHAMKNDSKGFAGFGEAYFSEIQPKTIKAWKRHRKMILNLIVPAGKVKFVMFDDRKMNDSEFFEVIISRENYCRLTIPPMIWFGFQGLSRNNSIVLNLASIAHDPEEVERKKFDEINFEWSKKQ